MTTLDANLLQVYKNMVGLGNIQNVSGNSTFLGGVSVNSNFYVSSTSIFNNSVTVRGGLYVSGLTIINNVTTILSSLTVSGPTIINGATSILSNLNVSGNTYITGNLSVSGPSIYLNGPTTIGSSLNVSGTGIFQQAVYTNSINAINNNLIIDGQTITIGNANSNVYINGTSTYIATTNLQIIDKLISLNLNLLNLLGADNGGNSGIEILGTSGTGYIKTNLDGTSFLIKAPANPNSGYIVIQDLNNSIYITGTSTLIGSTSVGSDLYVSGNTILRGSTSILSSLNVSGFTIINGSTIINNNLTVSGNTIIYGATTMNSLLNVSGNTCINGNTTIVNSLYVSGNSIINGNVSITSLLLVSGNTTIMGSQTIGNSLYVSGSSYLKSTTILSTLSVSGNTIINSSTSVGSNLNVSGTTVIGGSVSINSSLSVSGSASIYGNTSLMSTLNILGSMIASLPHYNDNATASAGGIPISGWYRTGGILKIRLDDTPPTITLNGPTSITLNLGTAFNDPGATSVTFDGSGNTLSIYIISLVSNIDSTVNLLSSSILITGTNTSIPLTSSLSAGTYTVTYLTTDGNDLTTTAFRSLTFKQINIPNLNMSGLMLFVSSLTYNINNNRWMDIINNLPIIPTYNTIWNSTYNYFVVQNNNDYNQLSVQSSYLLSNMKSIFLVLSFPINTYSKVLIEASIGGTNTLTGRNFTAINASNNYYSDGLSMTGYTDGVQNNAKFDGKFHIFLINNTNWYAPLNLTTLWFGGYNFPGSPASLSYNFPQGTRIAAIGIFDHTLNSTEINQIQTWFTNSDFPTM